MKFNKIVALVLALVMVFALCACGGDTKNKDDSGSTAKVDTSTVSVGAVVIARDDVPTDQIYAFVSTIFNNLDAIAAQHGKGAELSLEAAASVKGVPYHPGAAKYFEEKGLKVDAVKDGAGNGYINTDEDMAKYDAMYKQGGFVNAFLGQWKFVDQNGDGQIDNKDQIPYGYPSGTPEITYGASMSLSWKNLDFSMQWQGVGHKQGVYVLGMFGNGHLTGEWDTHAWT